MLIRFGFSNHCSFAEYSEVTFVASSIHDERADLLSYDEISSALLPSVLIYGANASGKTNIVKALSFMRTAVRRSHASGSPATRVPRVPFSFDRALSEQPSKFDIDFVLSGTRYHYGFTCDDHSFTGEWLYTFPNNRRQMLFEREGPEGRYIFGRELKGPSKLIESITRPNSLFLSAAAQNNFKALEPIFLFFEKLIIQTDVKSESTILLAEGEEIDRRVIEFLSQADTGIVEHRMNSQEMKSDANRKEFFSDLEKVMRRHIRDETFSLSKMENLKELTLGHKGVSGEVFFLPFDSESRGTRRLITLLNPIFDALDSGGIVVIDELDASLHTYICMEIVKLFNSQLHNRNGAQLLATTHDTNIMSHDIVRRDQILLAEKDEQGASHLYPLSDFKLKKTDNIERGYLRGRFGGVPLKLHL